MTAQRPNDSSSDELIAPIPRPTPLYVDLDGTLIATDMLHESVFRLLRTSPMDVLRLPIWLTQGKAFLKSQIAERTAVDVSQLPYREEVCQLIVQARAAGRRVVLATASDRRLAEPVADYLGLFDAVLASDGATNLSGSNKLAAITVDTGGEKHDFCYVGDSRKDIPIWKNAASAIVVNGSASLIGKVSSITRLEKSITSPAPTIKDYLYGIRVHQWLKNILIVLPLLPIIGSASLRMGLSILIAFLAFSLAASAVYVLNDLLDLEADRRHPRKRRRPFASGVISIKAATALCLGLLATAMILAFGFLSWIFGCTLIAYLILTTAYSFALKRRILVDVFTLAMLYTLRILAGAAAILVAPSFWILCFSLFVFLSLALAKRFVELTTMDTNQTGTVTERGYDISDQQYVMVAGLASGQISVLVLSLYLNDPIVIERYAHPQILWLISPLFLYWITRVWLKANRHELHDDPVVFAAKDRISRYVFALTVVIFACTVWIR